MNYAIVVAGGSGSRTGNVVPKQFLTVNEKPIIIYTMLNLQKCEYIDAIIIVCMHGWENFVELYAKQYSVRKVRAVIPGGEDRYQSMKNGVDFLSKECNDNDNVLIVDSNRPLIPHAIFKEEIERIKNGTCCISAEPCFDSMYISDGNSSKLVSEIDRSTLYKGQTPEGFKYGDIKRIFELSQKEGRKGPCTTLALSYGLNVEKVLGSSLNFKITTSDDIIMFKALVATMNN